MGDRSATIDVSQKLGAVPLLGGGAGSPRNTTWPGPRPTFVPSGILIHLVVWPHRHGRNFGGGCAPWGGAGSSSNTMLPGPRPTIVQSGILIHPAIWLQQTWAENWRGLCPLLGEWELRPPSSTMWRGVRPTSVPK